VIMKLYGIIVHAGGSSYSGHYYSFVRVGEAWYKVRVNRYRWTTVMYPNAVLKQYSNRMRISSFIRKYPKSSQIKIRLSHRFRARLS
jgi:ubiquitin C-terminal hydrolase